MPAPDGVLSPYLSHTSTPMLAAVAVIVAIAVNQRSQTSALHLRARGRVDVAQIFARPGDYRVDRYDSCGVLVRHGDGGGAHLCGGGDRFRCRPGDNGQSGPVQDHGRSLCVTADLGVVGAIVAESTGILIVDLAPTISVVIGVTILGHVSGAAAVATYGVAARVGSFVGGFIMPFTDSLFV